MCVIMHDTYKIINFHSMKTIKKNLYLEILSNDFFEYYETNKLFAKKVNNFRIMPSKRLFMVLLSFTEATSFTQLRNKLKKDNSTINANAFNRIYSLGIDIGTLITLLNTYNKEYKKYMINGSDLNELQPKFNLNVLKFRNININSLSFDVVKNLKLNTLDFQHQLTELIYIKYNINKITSDRSYIHCLTREMPLINHFLNIKRRTTSISIKSLLLISNFLEVSPNELISTSITPDVTKLNELNLDWLNHIFIYKLGGLIVI